MDHDQFKGILDAQIKRVRDILVVKTAEYATDDQLHNLRASALLKGESIPEAALGMMVKHTVSIFTMVQSGKPYPEALWDEKITDHIVWLVLLKAALIEGAQNPLDGTSPNSVSNFLRALTSGYRDGAIITLDDGYQIRADTLLEYAAKLAEQASPNPNQGELPC